MTAGTIETARKIGAGAQARPGNPITIRDILTPAFFFRRRAIIAFIIPIIFAFIVALLAPPVYVAQSKLLILLGDDYVARSPLGGGALPGLSFDRSQIVHAETEILGSRELAIQVLKAIGPSRLYPGTGASQTSLEIAADKFQKNLTIENVPQSNVMNVSYRNRDRKAAVLALNKLVELYLERRRSIFEQTNQKSLDQQGATMGAKLAGVEAQLAAMSSTYGFGDYAQEFSAVQDEQNALVAQGESMDQQLAMRDGRQALLDKRKGGVPAEVDLTTDQSRSQQIDALTQVLMQLLTQRREAAATYVDGSPLVVDLDKRIADVRAEIATTPPQQVTNVHRGANPVRTQLDTQIEDARADAAGFARGKAQVAQSLKQVNRRMADLVLIGPKYRDLIRQRTLLEAVATDLAKRSQDLRLSNSLSRSQANVRVLEAAQAPVKSHTGRAVMLAAGVAIGLIGAGAVMVLSVALFEGMLTPQEVEQKLEVPVILAPLQGDPTRPRGNANGLPNPTFLTVNDVKVLNRVLQSLTTSPCRSLMLIGPNEGVGVSSLLIDIALVIAQEGAKVLLLDLEPEKGHAAAETLVGRGATLEPIDGGSFARVNKSSLHVLLPDEGPKLALGESEWRAIIGQACRDYELVLVDSPPLSQSWLGLFAAPSVDATLAVIGAEETRAPVARNMIDRINEAGGNVVAAVFNKRRFYIPRIVYDWL